MIFIKWTVFIVYFFYYFKSVISGRDVTQSIMDLMRVVEAFMAFNVNYCDVEEY